MSQGKVYVVFEGRKPGIYLSLVDCEVQVTGYHGNLYSSYESYEKAELQWIRYCISKGREPVYIDRSLYDTQHVASRMGPSNREFAPDTDSKVFIMQYNMQRKLDEVCKCLRIPGPEYAMHEDRVVNGVEFRRYFGTLLGASLGTPIVSVGRFAKDEYSAKEDVAATLLRRLLAAMGKKIRDFNFYNVDVLETHINTIMDEKIQLEIEIAMLKEELLMKG